MNFPALVPITRLASSIVIAAIFVVQDLSPAAAQDNTLENFRSRIETLEQGIKDVRGTLERDLYAIRQAIEANKGLSGDDLIALRNQIDKLGDELSSVNNRLERTLSAVSDNEFRLLRMEKRLESLMRLSIDRSLDSTAATGPSNTGAGAVPGASLNADEDRSSVWTMNAEDLENSLGDAADQNAPETSEPRNSPRLRKQYRLLKLHQLNRRLNVSCLMRTPKINISSPLARHCRMILRPPRLLLKNSPATTTTMNGQQMRISGLAVFSSNVVHMKNP